MKLLIIVIAIVASICATAAFPQSSSGVTPDEGTLYPSNNQDEESIRIEDQEIQTEQTIISVEPTTILSLEATETTPMPNVESPSSITEPGQPEQIVEVVEEVIPTTETITPTVQQEQTTVTASNNTTVNPPSTPQPKDQPLKVVYLKTMSTNCLNCLRNALAFGQAAPGSTGGSNYFGNFHISWEYWRDAGNKTVDNGDFKKPDALRKCAENDLCAVETVKGYMNRYFKDCDGDGVVDCKDYFKIHLSNYGECPTQVEPGIKDFMYTCMWNKD